MNRTRVAALIGPSSRGGCRWIIAAAWSVACIFTIAGTASAVPIYKIVPLGLDDLEHTRNDGYKDSVAITVAP